MNELVLGQIHIQFQMQVDGYENLCISSQKRSSNLSRKPCEVLQLDYDLCFEIARDLVLVVFVIEG